MRRLFLPLIIIICIAPVLLQCEEQARQENIDYFFDGKWTTYTTSDGLVDNMVLSIAIDKAGNIWFGTVNGVSKFNGTIWTNYTISDGLVSNYVNAIAIDKEGNKWFGTWEGLSKFDGNKWTNYTPSNSNVWKYAIDIAIDAQDILWFSGFASRYTSLALPARFALLNYPQLRPNPPRQPRHHRSVLHPAYDPTPGR